MLCGHRGSGRGIVGGHRENTLASLRAAVAAGPGCVEVDARLTAVRFPLREAIPAAVHLCADVVGPHVTSFGLRPQGPVPGDCEIAEVVRAAHAAALQVLAWCPRPDEAGALPAAGVDCLVVDEPADWTPLARTACTAGGRA